MFWMASPRTSGGGVLPASVAELASDDDFASSAASNDASMIPASVSIDGGGATLGLSVAPASSSSGQPELSAARAESFIASADANRHRERRQLVMKRA